MLPLAAELVTAAASGWCYAGLYPKSEEEEPCHDTKGNVTAVL